MREKLLSEIDVSKAAVKFKCKWKTVSLWERFIVKTEGNRLSKGTIWKYVQSRKKYEFWTIIVLRPIYLHSNVEESISGTINQNSSFTSEDLEESLRLSPPSSTKRSPLWTSFARIIIPNHLPSQLVHLDSYYNDRKKKKTKKELLHSFIQRKKIRDEGYFGMLFTPVSAKRLLHLSPLYLSSFLINNTS